MTTTRFYKSTDASAPVLTGQVGSLIALLDACLVTGYGAQTAAGWTKPYTGTNIACFRNDAAIGSGMYLRVDDSGSGAGSFREALCRVYKTMSDVSTGTGECPTVAVQASGIVFRKSTTLDATARVWYLVADERTFYLCIDTGTVSVDAGTCSYAAGDYNSYIASDAYPYMISGRVTPGTTGYGGFSMGMLRSIGITGTLSTNYVSAYLGRDHTGAGGGERFGIVLPFGGIGGNVVGATHSEMLANPEPNTERLYFGQTLIVAAGVIRGSLRGIYIPLQTHAYELSGVMYTNVPGLPAGSDAVMFRHAGHTSFQLTWDCHFLVETAIPW